MSLKDTLSGRTIRCTVAMLLVAVLASVNYAVGISEPHHPVWDESYYLTSTQRYEDGIAQFASHPPLGLMLIAAGDTLLQVNRGIDTTALGRDKKIAGDGLPQGFSFAGVRAAPAVFAVAGAMAFFALMLALTQSVIAAALLANLYVFDNAFIAQFRAAQLDAFQIFFVICAVLCFVVGIRRAARDSYGPWSYALSFVFGLSCGLATMVKMNAVAIALLGGFLVFARARASWNESVRERLAGHGRWVARVGLDVGVMLVGGLLAIIAVFSLYVGVARHPPEPTTPAGVKDNDFVSAPYRDYLQGARPFSPAVVLVATQDYLRFIAADFAGMTRTDSNASGILQWPLNHKTINFRWDTRGAKTSYVQLSGNPFGWLLALVAPVAALCLVVLQKLRPSASTDPQRRTLMVMLLLQYVAFMALHGWLGTQRVMYVYHYFIGLLLAFCLVPLVWMEVAERWPTVRARMEPLLAGAIVLLLAGFVFYAPLTFHRPLTHAQCEWRNFFQRVVECRP
jgi:dolichyl-phosphate-mannose--protein O-mannosyl transferase